MRVHCHRVRSVACGLAFLAALGALSCARVGRERPEIEEPLKFDLQYEVVANGDLQCVLNIENFGTRPILVSRFVPVSAKSEVLYPPGSRGFGVAVQAGSGHPFDPEEFVYLFSQDKKHVQCTGFSVRFTLDSCMLAEPGEEYPTLLTVWGSVFVLELRGATDLRIEQYENKSWEGSFTAHKVAFSVKVPLPKRTKAKE